MKIEDFCKGVLAGALAGAVASALMNELVALYPKATAGRGHGAQSLQPGQPNHGLGAAQVERDGPLAHAHEDATERLAETVVHGLSGQRLDHREKHRLGTLIHYLFASGSAAAYGGMVELCPMARTGWGVPFGLAVWLGADEGAVPAIGLSTTPGQHSAGVHLASVGAHCAYGLTTEMFRRLFRKMI